MILWTDMKNKYAVELGRRGGKATKRKHGKDFFKRIGAQGLAAQGRVSQRKKI